MEKNMEIRIATTYKSYDDTNIDSKEQVRDLRIVMSNTVPLSAFVLEI